jgi:hypothetical protein
MATCLELVREQIKDLTEKELDEVLEQMRNRQARLMLDGADADTAAAQAGLDVASTLRAASAIERRNAAINLRIRTEALDYIKTTWNDDPVEGVLALLYGSPKARFGSRSSANAAQDAQFRRLMGGVAGELEASGVFDVLRRGEMDRDVARAMWHLDNPAEFAKLPEQAQAIATTLRKWQEVARIEANRHGAWIGKEPNYVVRQSHHPDRMATAGFETWKADIQPKLDLARMFPDGPPKDLGDWLHETYLNLTTGVRPDGEVSGERMAAFKGPGNLAKKASQERVIHFQSPDAWFDYNDKYGFGNMREAYVQGLHRSAESTGMMQVLGTNPEANLKSIVTAVRAQLSRSDPQLQKKFDAASNRIDRAYKEVSGFTRQVASQRLATFGAGVRALNVLTGLGGAVVSSVTDIPVRASALRFQGQSYLGELAKGMAAPIRRIVGGVGTPERKATLSALGYFNEIAMGNLATRFSPDENLPGRIQKATHTFFKWNLLGAWTDEMRRSSLESMGHFFGGLAEQDFGSLSERTRRTLERFRIGEKEWGTLRAGIVEESNGQRFLTPQAIRELDPQQFRSLARDRIRQIKADAAKAGKPERVERQVQRVLEDTREDMASRIQTLYADEVNAAAISPDARTLATLRQGTQAGTPLGEGLRLFWQFKSFGVAMMQKGFLREFYGYGKGAGGKIGMSEARGLAIFMAGSIGFGYMAGAMKDMLRGKEPRPIDNPKTWAAAAAQGGGFGIYGDFLFGEANRFGGGLMQTLSGPTVNKAEQVAQLFGALKRGDDVGAQALRLAYTNTPYLNLFYLKMATDYLVLYELQESLNPGYLRRMEKRQEEQTGQQWWIRPSDIVNQ